MTQAAIAPGMMPMIMLLALWRRPPDQRENADRRGQIRGPVNSGQWHGGEG